MQTIKDRFFAVKLSPEVPQSRELAPVTTAQIKDAVRKVYGVDESAFESTRRGTTKEPRDVAIYLARILRGDSLNRIAENFRIANYSTATSAVSLIKSRLKEEQSLVDQMGKVKRQIEKSPTEDLTPFLYRKKGALASKDKSTFLYLYL